MNARELLRQYLEQRRELGESEFVLDSLTVEAALDAIGARGTEPPVRRRTAGAEPGPRATGGAESGPRAPASAKPAPRATASGENVHGDDWRAALRAAGAEPTSRRTPGSPTIPPAAAPPPPEPPQIAAEPAITVAGSSSAPPQPSHAGDSSGTSIIVGSAERELFGGRYSNVTSIDGIAELVRSCTLCPLHATALNPVPGEGNPAAELVCVGEAPGANEDQTGRPFVGRAGELLTKILEAIDLSRDQVFICNVLKHRPPGNRNPAPDEIVACKPYLMRQLDLVRPKVILALGTFAAQTLLDSRLAIGKLRGNVHRFYGTPLVVTYHPAALLRNPHWKRPTWEDVKLVRRLLDSAAGDG